MRTVLKMACFLGVAGYVLATLMSCEDTTNPVPVTSYFLTVSAHPDSLPKSGPGSTAIIHAFVRDDADSVQAGGLHLEFSASIGNITGDAISSATDSTGIDPDYHYVYFSCQSCPDTTTIVTIHGSAFDNGDFVDSDSTHVTVFVP